MGNYVYLFILAASSLLCLYVSVQSARGIQVVKLDGMEGRLLMATIFLFASVSYFEDALKVISEL